MEQMSQLICATDENSYGGATMGALTDVMTEIKNGVKQLQTLEVRTVVGPSKWDEAAQKIIPDVTAKIIMTSINLIQGDITTAFDQEFLADPLNKVRDFHMEREKRAQEIINGNINALKELVNLLIKLATEGKQVVD
jgi:hypothetical protein